MFLLLLLSATLGAALTVPPPLVHDASLIALTKARAAAGDKEVLAAIKQAVHSANETLTLGPWSVTQSPHVAPDGDPRSYYSLNKYSWPCNANPCGKQARAAAAAAAAHQPESKPACDASTGLPWVDCDGHVNPVINFYAGPIVANMSAAVQKLATGFLFAPSRVDFAQRAAFLLRTFFLDSRLGMHPQLTFAQAEPGICNGTHWGVIELSSLFVELVLDSISFIANSGAWTDADQASFLLWLSPMAAWLRSSALGAQEAVSYNNHQIWYTGMLAGIDVWLGDTASAVTLLQRTREPPPAGNAFAPLGMQIAPDGELPAEEARTNSGGYVNFATMALLQIGSIARTPALVAAGAPDLLSYVTHSNGSSIKMAVDYMVPYVNGSAPWPFQNITRTPWNTYTEQYFRAAATSGWEASHDCYANTVAQLQPRSDDPNFLFWPLNKTAA